MLTPDSRTTPEKEQIAVGGRIAVMESFTEEGVSMKSFRELADKYERWAADNEAIASTILSISSGCPEDVRNEQLLQVSLLTSEAETFRHHAVRLRGSALGKTFFSSLQPVGAFRCAQ
jgi:hypothetical protein